MITRRSLGAMVLLGAAAVALGGCSLIEPSETLRYRLTVEVETPEGVKTGHSVWEYEVTDVVAGFSPQETNYRGEAVAVDLPGSKTLFALLVSGDGQSEYPKWVIEDKLRATPEYKADYEAAFLKVFPLWRQTQESWMVPPTLPPARENEKPPSGYPMLVTFQDIKDPASVARVDPDDLAASFGVGYRLKAITVQVTDEPVTVGIEGRLGWLEAVGRERATLIPNPPKYLDEIRDPAQRVNPGDFTTELYK